MKLGEDKAKPITLKLKAATQREEKSPKNRPKDQRPAHSHSQGTPKDTKLKACRQIQQVKRF